MVNFEQAFLSRADISEDRRIPHAVIVDEFPLFSAASGESFSIMLEQVRKYKGTLYLANQSLSQISKELAGSLQNAITIIFRLGFEDAQHFAPRVMKHDPYKVKHQVSRWPWEIEYSHPLYFTEAETTAQMRDVIQSLDTAKAIVRIGKQTTLIKAITVPDPPVPDAQVKDIEDLYAQRLCVPVTTTPVQGTTSPQSPPAGTAKTQAPTHPNNTPGSQPKRANRRVGK